MPATILRRARVRSSENDDTLVDIVIVDRAIHAAGAGPLDAPPGARRIDLEGRRLLPSFVDAHVHLREWALCRDRVRLGGEGRIDALASRVRAHAALARPGAWVLGGGWDGNILGRLPAARDLDGIDLPVALDARDGHALWCNAVALRAAGIRRGTPDPPGGRIERDAHGEPTGVLFENARRAVQALIPAGDADQDAAAIRQAAAHLLALGIGEVHDCSYRSADGAGAALAKLDASGTLPLRVAVAVAGDELGDALARGTKTGDGSPRLRTGALKQLADGTLGSRTAAMDEPFCGSTERGIMCIAPDELRANVRRAAAGGIASWIHCIGDRCMREALDAIEGAASADRLTHRIEHAQLTPPPLLHRTAALGVTLSVQPTHLVADMELARRHWGERAAHSYAYGSMARAGIPLAFGSDMPVEEPDPMASLRAAVLRRRADGTPETAFYAGEWLTLAEAIHAATAGGSGAGPWRGQKGHIAPGMLADLVVLEPDPFAIPPEELGRCRVVLHLLDGVPVFEA